MFVAAAALVAGCSEDLTSDLNVGPNGSENVSAVTDGISLEVSVEDVTRVTITGDDAACKSVMAWEVGDELTLVHNGQAYQFVATTDGKTAVFAAKGTENVLSSVDASKPVAVFYNVKSVDNAAMTATFDVAAEQVAGESSNKMPLYAYNATTSVVENKISLKMKPLASVVDFKLTANKSWNADALSLEPSFSESGTYVVASGATVNAATGAISLKNATVGNKVTVKLGSAVDFATTRNVQAVVMGLTYEKTEDELYAPIYHGKAVLKLYKNGAENVRYPIWAGYAPEEDAVDEHKHIYTTIANVLKHKIADGISTAEQMKQFADAVNFTTEMYPAGAEFSNEDGVVVLKNNITLTEQNWIAIGSNGKVNPQFTGIFDGGNNTIDGLNVNYNSTSHKLTLAGEVNPSYQLNAGLFGVLAKGGVIKNLTVEGQIIVNMDNSPKDSDGKDAWTYVGGIVAQVNGGTVQKCTSKVEITAGEYAAGKTRVGGIVGRAYCTTGDVVVKYCKNEGEINLEYESTVASGSFVPQIAGIVAIIADGKAGYTTTVTNCENNKKVSATNLPSPAIGGVIGTLSKVNENLGEFVQLKNTGAISAITPAGTVNVGGVIGDIAGDGVNLITIKECDNTGAVTLDDSNNGVVQPRVGGVVGFTSKGCIEIDTCENGGTVTVAAGTGAQCYVGGVVGRTNAGGVESVTLTKCENSGIVNVSATKTGWSYVGGISSGAYGGGNTNAYRVIVDGCTNSGRVSVTNAHATNLVTFRAGGILGIQEKYVKVYNCTHSGILAMENSSVKNDILGGIIGQLENYYGTVDSCTNIGTVCSMDLTATEKNSSGNFYTLVAGIIGNVAGTTPTVNKCVSKGYLLASHDAVNDWNAEGKVWVVGNNYQYRAAIFGNCKTNQPNTNCKVGGYVGVVKGGDGDDRYTATTVHKLVETEDAIYNFKRWASGYVYAPALTTLTYVDVDVNVQ